MFGNDREEKLRKKRGRVIRSSVWSIGLGIGLLIARYVAPLIVGESSAANMGFFGFGLALVGYGIAQLAAIVLLRHKALIVCSVITYLIMPGVVLWLIMRLS